MSDQEWCAHGPALNCKDCRIAELEAEIERLKREVDEREKLIVDNALLKEQIERLRAVYDVAVADRVRMHTRIAELEAEVERLREALLEITEMPCGEGDDSAGMKYVALQAIAAVQEDEYEGWYSSISAAQEVSNGR